MGHIAPIFVALAVLIAADEAWTSGLEWPWAALVPLTLPHLWSWATKRAFVAGHFRFGGFLYTSLGWLPALSFVVVVLGFGWAGWIARVLAPDATALDWPHVSVLLVLAPFVGYSLLAIDARARLGDMRSEEQARQRRFHTRMFLATLAPVLLLIVASWLIGLNDTLRANVEHVALWSGLFAAVLVVATMLLLPSMLRRVWQTSPLPAGQVRRALEGFAERCGFRCRELVLWHTGFQMSNAAVVGLGGSRIVMFTDLLLSQLPERELLAVFAHEIGHVVRHHVLVFVAWSLALFLGMELTLVQLELESELAAGALLLATLGVWYFAFGWYSRRIEVEADMYSVAVTGDMEAMVAALERVGGPASRALHSWRHFSTQTRVELLRSSIVDPSLVERWTRQLRWIGRAGLALGATVLAAQAWTLLESYPSDRLVVELALGRYEHAARLARDVRELDPDLASLIARAESLREDQRVPQALVDAGQSARAANQPSVAFELLSLAQLRGAPDLSDDLDSLAELLRTESR